MLNVPWISVGLDPDAWRMLLTAKHIAVNHTYAASRLPGYPIPEFMFSLVASDPAWVPLAMTFIVSCLGFLCFYFLVETLRFPDPALITAAFACVPVVLINSMAAMDYMWAMTFILASFYAAAKQWFTFAGILLGVAVGCRLTSGAMLAPLLLLAATSTNELSLRRRRLITLCAGAFVVSLACYVPVLQKYGLGMFSFVSPGERSLMFVIKTVAFDTFGIVGTCALVVASFLSLAGNVPYVPPVGKARVWSTACLFVIGLYAAAFAVLPAEAAYLIPLIPFLLLLSMFVMPRPLFRLVAYGCILSSFLVSVDATDRPWSVGTSPLSAEVHFAGRTLSVDVLRGPLMMDWMKRQSQLEYGASILRWARGHRSRAVLVVGFWEPMLAFASDGTYTEELEDRITHGWVALVGFLDKESAARYKREGYEFYHLTGQDAYNLRVYGVDLGALESKEVIP